MEIMLDGCLVTCTPEEYMELKRLGAFGDKPAEQGTGSFRDWLKRGTMDVAAVYGCNMPGPLTSNTTNAKGLSADTMSRLDAVVGNTPMLDGKYIFNPDTCTPGTETCGRCQRDEYCEKARMTKKAAYEDRQRLAARPTIVKLDNPEKVREKKRRYYEKLKQDPERLERKRRQNREYKKRLKG